MPETTTVAVSPKPWWKSVTIWFNVISFLLVVIPLLDAYVASTALVSEGLRVEIVRATALINAVGNTVLRLYFTKQPIEGTPNAEGLTRARVSPKVDGPG